MRRLAPLLLLALLACPGAGDLAPEPLDPLPGRDGLEGVLMQVADFQQPCRDDDSGSVVLCLRVRYEGEDAWSDLQATIENFSPSWGVRALLDVEVTQDAGQTTWLKLETLESEEMASAVFELTLTPDFLVGGARLVGGREFDCTTHELCTALDERLEAGDRFPAWFQHPEDDEAPLILVAVFES